MMYRVIFYLFEGFLTSWPLLGLSLGGTSISYLDPKISLSWKDSLTLS